MDKQRVFATASVVAKCAIFAALLAQPACKEQPTAQALPNEGVRIVPSPFVTGEDALLAEVPEGQRWTLRWKSDELALGETYSVSFFFASATGLLKDKNDWISLAIYDGRKRIVAQSLNAKVTPQYYVHEVTFRSGKGSVVLHLHPGQNLVFGGFGQEAGVNDLVSTRFRERSYLYPPDLHLPDVYRGLRRYRVKAVLTTPKARPTQALSLESIFVDARMHVSTAKLPRILPGQGEVRLLSDSAASGARLQLRAISRNERVAKVRISHDTDVPADGATFGRAFVTAYDASSEPLSGAYFRLVARPEVKMFPYVQAISDAHHLQTTREFHLSSTRPGNYAVNVDVWKGSGWVSTGETFQVRFLKTENPAPRYRRSDYPRRWLEPTPAAGSREPAQQINLPLAGSNLSKSVRLAIASQLEPEVRWQVTGPVENLGIFSSFQPDPRTLETTGRSLREIISKDGGSERDFALAIEEYVNLFMEGKVPEDFAHIFYQTPARIHREGRGWCANYASAIHALAVEGGLQARIHNTRGHVTGEVQGESLEPILIDALVQVAVTDPSGQRTTLRAVETPDARVIGFGANNKSRRGTGWNYFSKIVAFKEEWTVKDDENTHYLNRFLDDKVFSVSLKPWERLTWTGGYDNRAGNGFARGRLAVHQSVVTQTAALDMAKHGSDPSVEVHSLDLAEDGMLRVSEGARQGSVSFLFETPVEVDDLNVVTRGIIADGGTITLDVVPVLSTPLITDLASLVQASTPVK